MCTVKFTKKEKDFLIDWLSDDLNIEFEKDKTTDFSNPIVKKLLPTIIKKLKIKQILIVQNVIQNCIMKQKKILIILTFVWIAMRIFTILK